ncbi:MAG: transporter, partial [Acetobacteraceae bacterium]
CRRSCLATLILVFALLAARPGLAAEGATSFYLLGLHGPLAAVAPPPGVYFQNDAYIYSGRVNRTETLPFLGRVTAGARADVYLDLPTLLWQTPWQVAGGQIGITVTQPVGVERVVGRVIGGGYELVEQGTRTSYGDLAVALPINWSFDRLHLSVTPSVNIPSGNYNSRALSNVALHRWAGDLSLATTWLDTTTGLEASAIAGLTLNGRNFATNYRTGTEVHAEVAVSQYFSKAFSVGVIGGYLQQITADAGLGDSLGDFKGRVFAAGGMASYAMPIASRDVLMRAKVLQEFNVQNRLSGTAGILSIGFQF